MFPKFIFIRHAQSVHNQKTKEVKDKMPKGSDYKSSNSYMEFKYSEQLFDASITAQGKKQLQQAKKKINYQQIDTVIVSPLRRALESCDILFGDKNDIKIYVEPLLRERMTSACDIGSKIRQSKEIYGHRFNFDKIPESMEDHWYLNDEKRLKILEKLKDEEKNGNKNKIKVELMILKEMKEEHLMETKNEIRARAQKLKKQLGNFKRSSTKKIALVGHAGIFAAVTATGFHQNGQQINSVSLENAECKQIPIMIQGQTFEAENFVPFCSI